jgi:hypothetical protein
MFTEGPWPWPRQARRATTRLPGFNVFADPLHPVRAKGVPHLHELAKSGLATDEGAGLRPVSDQMHDHVGREELAPSVHVARVPGIETRLNNLYCVPRHDR